MATTLMVTTNVKDFETWKAAFDGAAPMRDKMGIKILGIYRNMDNQNNITVLSEYASIEMAKAILASPEWEAAQNRAGVIGGFDVKYYDKVQ